MITGRVILFSLYSMNVLVDTNIFIASMRFTGLKRKILWKLLESDSVIVLTDFIVEELRQNFEELYSPSEARAALNNLLYFLGTGNILVKTHDSYSLNIEYAKALTAEKDAPILAALMLDDVDYLLTRDKKDFLNNSKLAETYWFKKIKSPQELLTLL